MHTFTFGGHKGMSDEQHPDDDGVRRVSKGQRKNKIETQPLQFPAEPDDDHLAETQVNETASGENGVPIADDLSDEELAPLLDALAEIKPQGDDEAQQLMAPTRPMTLPPMGNEPPADEEDATTRAPAAADMRFAPPTEADTPAEEPEADPLLPTVDELKPPPPPGERYPPVEAASPQSPPRPRQAVKIRPAQARRRGRLLTGVIIAAVVLLIGLAVAYVAFIVRNPYSRLNPLPPPTPLPILVTATFLPPTETVPPTLTPVLTEAEAEAASGTAVAGAVISTPSPITDATEAVTSGGAAASANSAPDSSAANTTSSTPPFQFVDPPGVLYTPNGNGRECEWSSIAGIVQGLDGEPVNGLRVRFTDQTTGEENTVFTGSSTTFGDGGFELPLGNTPQVNGYFVQLFSEAGAPLSEELTVVTSERCDQNVTIVTFEQTQPY